ncbi:MAG: S8 family serine peptidase [Woeseiaceae bacterium]|nr:S8 family serine peptidase [Woeseiaceae bacterium]
MTKSRMHAVYIIAAAAVLGFVAPADTAIAQLGLPQVPGGLRDLPTDIDRNVRTRAERAADKAAEEAEKARQSVDGTVEPLVGTATGVVDTVTGELVAAVNGVARTFVAATAPDGSLIEADVVVALLDDDERDALQRSGAQIISERTMGALGKTLVTLRRPDGVALPDALRQLRSSFPDSAIDYNHLYRLDQSGELPGTRHEEIDIARQGPASGAAGPRPLRVGVIDSAVLARHPALQSVRVVENDFVTSEHARPLTHGTAVASLIVKSAGEPVEIYSASVFFQVPGHMPGASTEGLVAALDWLVAEDVDVINMSLSGPSNELLQVAVDTTAERGKVVVAAVGNNGPAGEPLYPGAYDSVIGVTAVDREHRIFRNANRGEHVDYAAVGVNVKVADSTTGSFTIASGTSMAAPHVAVVVAKTLRDSGAEPGALRSWLIASAKDLGRKGFDPVYGHGLITQPPAVVSGL